MFVTDSVSKKLPEELTLVTISCNTGAITTSQSGCHCLSESVRAELDLTSPGREVNTSGHRNAEPTSCSNSE
jgi:hypothetical protein